MPDVLDISAENGHLVEPPIIDSLHRETARRLWVISFIPEPSVSTREKEQVVIDFGSSEGRRITLRMKRLGKLFGRQIDRIFHGGGGNFSFVPNKGKAVDLADPQHDVGFSVKAYGELTDIAMTAQIAFLSSKLAGSRQ
jgi:hypothetical protein